MTLQRYRINNCADIKDDNGGYCLSEDVAALEKSKWISVFDRLPEVSGQYECVLHGIYGSEMVEFNKKDIDDDQDRDHWWDSLGHSNGGCTQYHNSSQATIEHRATYHTVTHWLEKPDYPESIDAHELYLKITTTKL